jgi:hypothetical protein
MKFEGKKTLKPMVKVVSEFNQLGKIGIISEYWNSYIISCSNPNMIVATPNDKSIIKNYKFVVQVFKQKNIYIIKDMWLNEFPDTIQQFGHILVKNGKQFNLGGCTVCKYNNEDTTERQ